MKAYLLSFVVLLSACSVVQPTADIPRLGESNWKLISVDRKPVSFGDRAFLKFDEKEKKISGKAVCNSFSSDYEMIGNKISFPAIASTKMYCEGIMDDESQIVSLLQQVSRYEVKSDMLYLYAGDRLALTFRR